MTMCSMTGVACRDARIIIQMCSFPQLYKCFSLLKLIFFSFST